MNRDLLNDTINVLRVHYDINAQKHKMFSVILAIFYNLSV